MTPLPRREKAAKPKRKKPDVLSVQLFGTKLLAGGAARSAAAWKEAAASVSLDGCTQSCGPHPQCGSQHITAAERELVEAALRFVARHTGGRKCSIELDPENCGSSETLIEATKAVRSEREKAGDGK